MKNTKNKYTSTVFRLVNKETGNWVGEWDGYSYNYDWQDKNDLIGFARDCFGPAWQFQAEIQKWQIIEERVLDKNEIPARLANYLS